MCGIVAYIGPREAYPILMKGLHRLEYRGYDSAGICLLNGDIKVYKCKGKVSELEDYVAGEDISGTCGMAHTRWATHGEPNQINAHPHFSKNKSIAIIHNGIIENYLVLRSELRNRGYEFTSETDTEVLGHLIEDIMVNEQVPVEEAVRIALNQVIGAYAIVILARDFPDKIIAARKGSPMVIGIGQGEFFVASDATPLIEYTDNVVYMNDEEIAIIERGKELKIKTVKNQNHTPYIQKLAMSLNEIEKGGFNHFMLKEIYEQPRSIRDSMRGRLHLDQGLVTLGGIQNFEDKLLKAKRIIITACGTSWHAGLVGEYLIEDFARIPVEVEYSSEFRYRNPVLTEEDVIIAISQSGETADTLAAIELGKSKGATVLGICNVVGSSIARATHAGVYTHAGPEIGVASTKAFTAQVAVLTLLAILLAQKKGNLSKSQYHTLLLALEAIPEKVERILKLNDQIRAIANIYKDVKNSLYLGRGYNFPVALEGALKLKEISYIHAEGYPAAEMKHGPIALIDEHMPVVFLATRRGIYEKVITNIEEVKARKGKIIAIITEGDESVKKLADHYIEIPDTEEVLIPLLATIPLQLLSYHIAVMRGCNVDQPRNLAKSVTVE
ncbi:MAG TPA: glutamine--fructose-6-phosphate transaminase (isomerizing) [Bacteroidales bacterium]|nr:glutamine--fructose-6-phosphate transaminase (isomerizing) [Bacteroidales bacterium]HPT10639.1 glutamine--fructose-6-phosphate transaminase (isomerizing) [Bacteroidales bacterium]